MVDRDDSGHRFGDVGIETLYDGMAVAAAKKASVQRARQQDVIDKLARPDEHWSVFEARNRFADHHDLPLKRRSRADAARDQSFFIPARAMISRSMRTSLDLANMVSAFGHRCTPLAAENLWERFQKRNPGIGPSSCGFATNHVA